MPIKVRPGIFVASLVAFMGGGCGAILDGPDESFPPFNAIDHVQVNCNSRQVASVTDPASVNSITIFANQRLSHWSTPWAGIPVPNTTVGFYSGKTFVGHFGSGVNFFETQREGGFFSREASPSELNQFKAILQSAAKPASLATCFGS